MMTASTVGEKDAVGIDEASVTLRHLVWSLSAIGSPTSYLCHATSCQGQGLKLHFQSLLTARCSLVIQSHPRC